MTKVKTANVNGHKNIAALAVIKSAVVTEKSTLLSENGQVVFYVNKTATKPQIKEAVEAVFSVKVEYVNTLILKGKKKNFKGHQNLQQDRKKAIVSLKDGQKIDLGSGI
jgi:large subunit ribosomal protein L23